MYLLGWFIFHTVLPVLWFYFVPPLVTFITELLLTQVPYGEIVLLVLAAPFVYIASNYPLSEADGLQHFASNVSQGLGFFAYFYGMSCLVEADLLGLSLIDTLPRVGWWAVMSVIMFFLPNIITSAMMTACYQLGILGDRGDFVAMLLTCIFYRATISFPDHYLNSLIDGIYQQGFDGEDWG